MKLTPAEIVQFETQGYLVVPNVVPADILNRLHAEYTSLLDQLYKGWFASGQVITVPASLDFWGKLRSAYKTGSVVLFHPLAPHAPLTNKYYGWFPLVVQHSFQRYGSTYRTRTFPRLHRPLSREPRNGNTRLADLYGAVGRRPHPPCQGTTHQHSPMVVRCTVLRLRTTVRKVET